MYAEHRDRRWNGPLRICVSVRSWGQKYRAEGIRVRTRRRYLAPIGLSKISYIQRNTRGYVLYNGYQSGDERTWMQASPLTRELWASAGGHDSV